jgi:RNA polymerase sigma-70 factor (sigma-E family)
MSDPTLALVRTASVLTGNRSSAEDLVQATLVRVWPRWERVSSMDNVDACVRRVMMSIFLSWRKRFWTREVASESLPDAPARGDSAGPDDRTTLLAVIGELAPKQRVVIALRFFLDLTEADTADALGCSVGTVKSQTSRALTRLRALIPVEMS